MFMPTYNNRAIRRGVGHPGATMDALHLAVELIPWNAHFETGLDVIDQQHRQLVARVNQLAALFLQGRDESSPNDLMTALLGCVEHHFSIEEAVWDVWLGDHEGVAAHRRTHADFLDALLRQRAETAAGSPDEVAERTLRFLTRRLAHHILDDDKRLARMALAVRAGASLREAAHRADEETVGMTAVPIETLSSLNEMLFARALGLIRERTVRVRTEEALQASRATVIALRQQHDMQRLINELASDFMAATTSDFDAAIDRILRRSGEYFDADRSYVFVTHGEGKYFSNTHEWCAAGIEPQRESLQDHLVEAAPWWWGQLRGEGRVLVRNIADLPDEAAAERTVLESQDILSVCAFPIGDRDGVFGFVGFDAVRDRRDWADDVIQFGATIGDLIGIALGYSRMHRSLWESENRYRALFESLADAVIVVDAGNGLIVDANREAETLTGRSVAELRSLLVSALHPPESCGAVQRHLEVSGKVAGVVMTELVLSSLDGRLIPVEVRSAGHYSAGEQSLVVSVYRDISERKDAEARIRHMAQHDALTGLPNRALFDHLFEATLEAARRDQSRFALLFADLDNLKPVNDGLGHAVGDLLLKQVADRIRRAIGDTDTAARIGGDEFLILVRDVRRPEDAATVAEQVLRAVSEPCSLEGRAILASISIGIALYPVHGTDAFALTRHADQAMYRAKVGGKNGFAFAET